MDLWTEIWMIGYIISIPIFIFFMAIDESNKQKLEIVN